MVKSALCKVLFCFLSVYGTNAIANPFDFDFLRKETLVTKHSALIETPPTKISTGSVLWLKSKQRLARKDKIFARIFTLLPYEERPFSIEKYSDEDCKTYISAVIQLDLDYWDSKKLKVASIDKTWLFPTKAQDGVYGKYLIVLERSDNPQRLIRLKTDSDGSNETYFSSGFIINVEADASLDIKIIEEVDSKRLNISDLVTVSKKGNPPCFKATYVVDSDQKENSESIKLAECDAELNERYQIN